MHRKIHFSPKTYFVLCMRPHASCGRGRWKWIGHNSSLQIAWYFTWKEEANDDSAQCVMVTQESRVCASTGLKVWI